MYITKKHLSGIVDDFFGTVKEAGETVEDVTPSIEKLKNLFGWGGTDTKGGSNSTPPPSSKGKSNISEYLFYGAVAIFGIVIVNKFVRKK